MRFEARELKPFAKPVSTADLKEGSVYFSVTFVDEDMKTPVMDTLVFVSRDSNGNTEGALIFQDVDSYRRGVRYAHATDADDAVFFSCAEGNAKNIFEYENALEILMLCSLRRRGIAN
jgi:hypothetical protein